jgi:DNA-binding transcriptional ArsR family regulator
MATALASEKKRVRLLPAMAEMREHAGDAAGFLKALANDQRLLVLCALLDGELSVGEINERVPLSQSALSQHLSVLREAGLVTTTRQSQTIYYAVARGPALQIMEILYATFCAPAGSGAAVKTAKCSPPKKS